MTQKALLFPATTVPVQEDGWLSPEGVYYPCGYYYHSEAADEIAGVDTWELEERGWVHISGSRIRNGDVNITQAQRDTLFDMYMVDPESTLALRLHRVLHINSW